MRINSIYNYNYTNAYKTRFQSFGANDNKENNSKVNIGFLYHRTYFFRDYETNKFVTKFIRENMSSKPEINIVSAGCSSGEEVYSIAMMLDDMKDKVKITGFDASETEVDAANKAVYFISDDDDDENYLLKPTHYFKNKPNSSCEPDMVEKFQKYFKPLNSGGSRQYMLEKGALDNCKFFPGYVEDLSKSFKENSIDVLIMRNVLYHIIYGQKYRPLPNSRKIFTDIAQQMSRV